MHDSIIKRYIVILLTLMVSVPHILAQTTAAGAFASAPSSVFPLLDRSTRLDMIDYFKSGSTTASKNAMDGQSRVSALSPMKIDIAMTDASSYQICLLPAKSDTIVAVIQTLSAPARDSKISFYTSGWQRIDTPIFQKPRIEDWLISSSEKDMTGIKSTVPFMLAEYSYDPATLTLSLTNTLSQFLSADVYSMIAPMLHQKLVYRWNGSKFQLQK